MISPNDSGKFPVELCERIKIDDLLVEFRNQYKEAFIKSSLKVMGIDIELTQTKTPFEGVRLWFMCPICGKRIGVLYKHPVNEVVGCRECLNVEYGSRL